MVILNWRLEMSVWVAYNNSRNCYLFLLKLCLYCGMSATHISYDMLLTANQFQNFIAQTMINKESTHV